MVQKQNPPLTVFLYNSGPGHYIFWSADPKKGLAAEFFLQGNMQGDLFLCDFWCLSVSTLN